MNVRLLRSLGVATLLVALVPLAAFDLSVTAERGLLVLCVR